MKAIVLLPLCVLVLNHITSASFAQTVNENGGNLVPERLGLVQVLDTVELPAREEGLLTNLAFHIGDNLTEGTRVAEIDAQVVQLKLTIAEAELAQAQRNAENNAKLRKAQSALELAEMEFRISQSLRDRQVASTLDFEKSNATLRQAEIEAEGEEITLEILRDSVAVKEAELKLATQVVTNRTLYAPFHGTIDAVLKHQGEWVKQGDGVVRIVRMDRLRVQTFVDPAEESPFDLQNANLEVVAQISPMLEQSFDVIGQPSFSPIVEADGQWIVWIEIENRRIDEQDVSSQWLLRPGMPVTVRIRQTNNQDDDEPKP